MSNQIQHQIVERAQDAAALTTAGLPLWMQWSENVLGFAAVVLGLVWLCLRIVIAWRELRASKKDKE